MTRSVRNMRTPRGRPKGRRKKVGTGVLLLLGLFAGFIGFAPSAFAHHPAMNTPTVVCSTTTPGGWTVTGTSTAWQAVTQTDRAHDDIEIYWGPASVSWPTPGSAIPGGAIFGAQGQYKNDPPASEPDYSFPYTFEVPATFSPGAVIEVISFANGPWGNGNPGFQWSGLETGSPNGAPLVLTLPSQAGCGQPSLQLNPVVQCVTNQAGVLGVNVTVTNTGTQAGSITLTTLVNGVAGPSLTFTNVGVGATSAPQFLAVPEDGTYSVSGPGVTTQSGTNDCAAPAFNLVVVECAANGGVTVTVTNTGGQAGSITLSTVVNGANGTLTFTNVGANGGTQSQNLAVPEDGTYSVSGPGVTTQSGTNDCAGASLGPVEVVECATVDGVQGINVTISNNGGQDGSATVTPTVGGVVGAGVVFDVPALGSVTKFIEVGEDVGYSLSFAGDFGTPQADVTGTNDCVTVGGKIVTPGAAQLPRTGSNTMSLLSLAGALLLAGAALVAGGRRRQAEVLSYDGDLPTTVLVGGIAVEAPAGASESYFIPLAEDATTDVLVTSGGDVLYDANVVRNRETVGGKTVTPGSSSLPRTGGNTTGLLSLAGALLLAGAALVAGGRRRQDEVLS